MLTALLPSGKGDGLIMKLEAYRGVMTECPANTMPAYISAFEQGYNSIRVDVLATDDGALVAHHDEERICRYSYVRLLREDFGILFSEKFEGTTLHFPKTSKSSVPRFPKILTLSSTKMMT